MQPTAKAPIGATVISILVVVGFFGMTYLRFAHPEVKDDQILTMLYGAMIGAFTTVISYWLGSSRSSATKDDAMQATAAKLADATITPAGDDGKSAVRVTEVKK